MENLFMLLDAGEYVSELCDGESGISKILIFIGFLVQLLRWGIPVVLIIMGTIDVGKAVIEQDDKKQKAAYQKFLKRLMAAIVVFLIPSIVNLMLGVFVDPDSTFDACKTLILGEIDLSLGTHG